MGQGLYRRENEHDACGVGMVVNIRGDKSHELVEKALAVLENMRHRGAEGADGKSGDGAGIMSVLTLISAVAVMLILEKIAAKFKLKWLETFAMPISMFAAMGVAILISVALPENIAYLEWRG